MKNILIISAIVFATSYNVFAQDNHKYDPTYSIHNYKHPNKAKVAKERIKYDTSGTYVYVAPAEIERNRNYKQQNNLGKSYSTGVRRAYKGEAIPSKKEPVNQNSVFSNRNYKRQF